MHGKILREQIPEHKLIRGASAAVVKLTTNRVVSCHRTRQAAEKYRRELRSKCGIEHLTVVDIVG